MLYINNYDLFQQNIIRLMNNIIIMNFECYISIFGIYIHLDFIKIKLDNKTSD